MARIGHIGLSVFHTERVWINWLEVDNKKIPVPEVGAAGGYYAFADLPDQRGAGGRGLVLGEISGGHYIGGIDLDGCYQDGALAAWAEDIVEEIGSYTEVSPSGHGVKIFFTMDAKAAKVRMPRKHVQWPKHATQGKAWGIEAYTQGDGTRFFTVTNQVYGTHREVTEVSARKLKWLGERMKDFEVAGRLQKRAVKAMSFIKNEDLDWDTWVVRGMALYNATWASPAGREAWFEFSRKSEKFEAEETGKVWEHWRRSPADNLGLRDVEKWASQYGYEPEDDIADELGCKEQVLELNKKWAQVQIGLKSLIMTDSPEAVGMFQLYSLMYIGAWKETLEGYTPRFGQKNQQLHEIWLESRYRRQYSGIELAPPGIRVPDTVFNLWQGGWAVTPIKPALCGGWSKFRAHLGNVVCGGNEANYKYLLQWMAYKIQNPGKKIGVAVVLRGDKGAGKTIVCDYLAKIFGVHFVRVSQQTQLLGKFNAHLEHALLVDAEEAFWAGNKKDEGVLKDLITGDRLMIEGKGLDVRPARNLLDLIITSNSDWTVPASHDERRFFVLDVSGDRIKDYPYFRAIIAEMNGQGPNAMLYDLLNMDLSNFEPREAPETEGMWFQKEVSMHSHERFFLELATEGKVPGMDEKLCVKTKDIYDMYKRRVEDSGLRERVTEAPIFGKLSHVLGCFKRRRRGREDEREEWVWMTQFPTLAEFRAAVDKYFNHTSEWSDKLEWTVLREVPVKGVNIGFGGPDDPR